ncbi:MAG TPA: hypothetical protein VMW50_08315 [Dehalococcoidia bacterium]|nr:hypothetical protein [Dehalococcoidia bacterium]
MMNWQDVLQSVNWPTTALIIDFETYFDSKYSLSKMSTIEYLTDPRFELHGFGIFEMHQPFAAVNANSQFIDADRISQWINILQTNYGKNLERCTVVVKNAMFDITLMQVHFGIVPLYIIDIDNLLRYYDARMSHKMKDVAPACGLQPKGDTKQFLGKHTAEIDIAAMVEYCRNDIEIEVELFRKFLPLLTNPELEIPLQRHTLKMYLEPRLTLDYAKAKELIEQMQAELDAAVEATGHTAEDISGDISFARIIQEALGKELLPVKPGEPTKNMIPITGPGKIPALAQNDDGMKYLLQHKNPEVRQLAIAKQAISSWPNHIKRIKSMVAQAKASGGKLRIPLYYYGGHTGRWSGTQGINPQNFGGRGRMRALHPLIGQIRELIITE